MSSTEDLTKTALRLAGLPINQLIQVLDNQEFQEASRILQGIFKQKGWFRRHIFRPMPNEAFLGFKSLDPEIFFFIYPTLSPIDEILFILSKQKYALIQSGGGKAIKRSIA